MPSAFSRATDAVADSVATVRRPLAIPTVLALAVPVGLFALALAVRLVAAAQVSVPPTQVSAYYIDVARNLATGRGLVGDAIWSYATSPLTLPQPAFALWMPMASLIAALPMIVPGQEPLAGAQVAFALLGALLAPLTWLVAREAAARNGLAGRRATAVAVGAGLLVAFLGPALLAARGPDSWTPFTVFAVAACLLMPRLLERAERSDRRRWLISGILLGLCLGLAYLSRQEAAEFGVAYLALLIPAARRRRPPERRAWLARTLGVPVVAGLVVVVPWFVRSALTFGSVGSQALENVLFTRNEDVFAYGVRPSFDAFLAQGPRTILTHVAGALWSQLSIDLLVTAAPVGLVGLLAWLALRRSPALGQPTALRALLLAGALIFLVTGLLFPVSTLWGTFRHAAGPLLMGLAVTSALGLDAFIARVARWRAWDHDNAWLATLVLLVTLIPVAALEVQSTAGAAREADLRLNGAALALTGAAAGDPQTDTRTSPVITDWPIWLASELGRPALALPDESPATVLDLAHRFGARFVVILSPDGPTTVGASGSGTDQPGLPDLTGQSCFTNLPLPATAGPGARLYRIESGGPCGS
jgi:hypothetical protein